MFLSPFLYLLSDQLSLTLLYRRLAVFIEHKLIWFQFALYELSGERSSGGILYYYYFFYNKKFQVLTRLKLRQRETRSRSVSWRMQPYKLNVPARLKASSHTADLIQQSRQLAVRVLPAPSWTREELFSCFTLVLHILYAHYQMRHALNMDAYGKKWNIILTQSKNIYWKKTFTHGNCFNPSCIKYTLKNKNVSINWKLHTV